MSKVQRHNRIASILTNLSPESALSISAIWELLKRDGFKVNRKTIERDVAELSITYSALSETSSNPTRYYFAEGFKLNYSLNFSEEQLQTIILALGNLRVSAPKYIQKLCTEAEDTLLSRLPSQLKSEFKILKLISSSGKTSLGQAREIEAHSFETILKCLKNEFVFHCYYQKPDQEPEERLFAPLLMNFSSGTPHLYVYNLRDMEIKTLRIDRIHRAKATEIKVNRNRVKEIDMEYVMGGFGRGQGDTILDYVIHCDRKMANSFQDQIFHPSQEVVQMKDGQWRISFKMNSSDEVIRKLSQFGDSIYKIEPAEVYEKVQNIWKKGLKGAA